MNDASLLPDAPGVNPQAAIMTIAARNADHFLADAMTVERCRRPRRSSSPARPAGSARTSCARWRRDRERVRCLVRDDDDASMLAVIGPSIEPVVGDVRDPVALDALFDGVGPATVFHAAGRDPSRRKRPRACST